MLKSQIFSLTGRDISTKVRLTELSALQADRYARAALERIDVPTEGGIVALAMQHAQAVRSLGEEGQALLMPFVQATRAVPGPDHQLGFDLSKDLRDWRNIERIQHAALLLHAGFMVNRTPLDVPVSFTAQQILQGTSDLRVTFASPHITAVLDSRLASYRELETVLSTEDVYNLVEILNVAALREWHARPKE